MKTRILDKIIENTPDSIHDQDILDILNTLHEERYALIQKIGFYGNECSADVLKLLCETSSYKKDIIAIIGALGNCRMVYRALPPLLEMSEHPDIDIQNAAINAIGKHGSRASLNILHEKMKTSVNKIPFIRALGMIGSNASLDLILEHLARSKKQEDICECLLAASEVRNTKAVPVIAGFLKGFSEKIRITAIMALGIIGGSEALKFLSQTSFNEKNQETAHLIFWAMENIRREICVTESQLIDHILKNEAGDFLFLKRNARKLKNYHPSSVNSILLKHFRDGNDPLKTAVIKTAGQIENSELLLQLLREPSLLKNFDMLLLFTRSICSVSCPELHNMLFELYRKEPDKNRKWVYLESAAMTATEKTVEMLTDEFDLQKDNKLKSDIIRACTKAFLFNKTFMKHLYVKKFLQILKKCLTSESTSLFSRAAQCAAALHLSELAPVIIAEIPKHHDNNYWALTALAQIDSQESVQYIQKLVSESESVSLSLLKCLQKSPQSISDATSQKLISLFSAESMVVVHAVKALSKASDVTEELQSLFCDIRQNYAVKSAVLNTLYKTEALTGTKLINVVSVSEEPNYLAMLVDILCRSNRLGDILFIFKLISSRKLEADKICAILEKLPIPDSGTDTALSYLNGLPAANRCCKAAIARYRLKLTSTQLLPKLKKSGIIDYIEISQKLPEMMQYAENADLLMSSDSSFDTSEFNALYHSFYSILRNTAEMVLDGISNFIFSEIDPEFYFRNISPSSEFVSYILRVEFLKRRAESSSIYASLEKLFSQNRNSFNLFDTAVLLAAFCGDYTDSEFKRFIPADKDVFMTLCPLLAWIENTMNAVIDGDSDLNYDLMEDFKPKFTEAFSLFLQLLELKKNR